ncbi:MAG: glycosyltransferase family 39 protein [Acidobacteriota bacterium]
MLRPKLLRVLLVAQVLSLLFTPLQRDLFVGDETKYGQVVREMRATHTFFLPTLQGTPFTHKPPLHFWLIELLTFVFGVYSTWSFVLPSIVAFALLLWLMHRYAGPLAAFVCGASTMIWASGQTARMDVSFTALITLAAFLMERFFDEEDFRPLLLAGVALGVATLVKGPMAPVIALALFLFEWLRRKRAPPGNYLPAVLVMIVIPLLWTVPAMIMGGSSYRREIVMKQTVGRAVGAWVHRSPPWYYLAHLPAIIFPWCFIGIIAAFVLWRGDRRERFCCSWIAAVLVPYSLMSSKLDIYMMALLPPMAVLVAGLIERPAQSRGTRAAHAANLLSLAALVIVGIAAPLIGPRYLKPVDAALASNPAVTGVFIVLAAAAAVGLLLALRARSLFASSVALGVVPLITFVYLAVALMPLANEMASTQPLVAALKRQAVAADSMALYWSPFLWTRVMPRELEKVHYPDAAALAGMHPQLIATSRARAGDIASSLAGYQKVDELRMIGKWFDIYRLQPGIGAAPVLRAVPARAPEGAVAHAQ